MPKYPSLKDREYKTRKEIWNHIISGADTKESRFFDIALLWAILLSVLAIMAESVPEIERKYGTYLNYLEYFFTILFTIEYVVRIYVSENPKKYITSFWGVIDLFATLPTYLGFFFQGPQLFRILRIVRLIRVFRILRLKSFMIEAQGLGYALKRASAKIIVFFAIVLIIVIVMGTIMFTIEPQEAGFTSIPRSIYWAIVTLTTVGYGDIAPVTALGQFLSAALMILGYAVIAVPTGIVSVEVASSSSKKACVNCGNKNHTRGAKYCSSCGEEL
jgi:voltage-gated potassium channel